MIRAIARNRDGAPHQVFRVFQRAMVTFSSSSTSSSHPFLSPACSAIASAHALQHQHPQGYGGFFPWRASPDAAAASSGLDIYFGIALQTLDSDSFVSVCCEDLVQGDLLGAGNRFNVLCCLCRSNFDMLEKNHESRCSMNSLYRFHRPENAGDLPASRCGFSKQHVRVFEETGKVVQQLVKGFKNEISFETLELGQIKFVLPELEQHIYPLEVSSVKRKRKKKMNKHKQRKLRRRDRHRK